jgi:hypothetical protein
MTDSGSQPTNGLVIMALRVRDPDRREQIVHRLLNILADRVTSTIYEFATADWDEGSWNDEIEWLSEILEGTRDSIVVWHFAGNNFTRFTIGDR